MLNNEANVVLVTIRRSTHSRGNSRRLQGRAPHRRGAFATPRPAGERALNWLAYTTYRAVMKLLTVGGSWQKLTSRQGVLNNAGEPGSGSSQMSGPLCF